MKESSFNSAPNKKHTQLTDWNLITRPTEKIQPQEIIEIINDYLKSYEIELLQTYNDYYDTENTKIKDKHTKRYYKSITPNELVTSGYYKTIVDTMAGFMFSNVDINSDNEQFVESINEILENNYSDVKDMQTGVNALAFNKGVELVYTTGDGTNKPEIKFASLDPRQMIFVYTDEIEPQLYAGIRVINSNEKDQEYDVDVFYADEWQKYKVNGNSIIEREEAKRLYFTKCPVIDYRGEIVNNRSPFHQILRYIDALDLLLSGNASDIEKLADAILVLSQKLEDEDKKDLGALKVIDGMTKEDVAEYLTKDMSPAFREYISKLFIKEIHKHSHTIDWFDAENVSGEASGRALRIRLFDMMMYSKRIEKVFIKGYRKRIELISEIMRVNKLSTDERYEVVFNRELPDNFLDLAPVLNQIQFLSTDRKLEMLGEDVMVEKERLQEEKKKNMETFMANQMNEGSDFEEENEDDVV